MDINYFGNLPKEEEIDFKKELSPADIIEIYEKCSNNKSILSHVYKLIMNNLTSLYNVCFYFKEMIKRNCNETPSKLNNFEINIIRKCIYFYFKNSGYAKMILLLKEVNCFKNTLIFDEIFLAIKDNFENSIDCEIKFELIRILREKYFNNISHLNDPERNSELRTYILKNLDLTSLSINKFKKYMVDEFSLIDETEFARIEMESQIKNIFNLINKEKNKVEEASTMKPKLNKRCDIIFLIVIIISVVVLISSFKKEFSDLPSKDTNKKENQCLNLVWPTSGSNSLYNSQVNSYNKYVISKILPKKFKLSIFITSASYNTKIGFTDALGNNIFAISQHQLVKKGKMIQEDARLFRDGDTIAFYRKNGKIKFALNNKIIKSKYKVGDRDIYLSASLYGNDSIKLLC